MTTGMQVGRGRATASTTNVSYRIGRFAGYISGRWLDCGCAEGGYVAALLGEGASTVVGMDVEADRAAQARGRALDRASFCVGVGESLPFRTGTFDGVFLNEVLEHVANEDQTLREIHRVLRPGGTLVVMSPNRWFPFEGHSLRVRDRVVAHPTPLVPWLPYRVTQRYMTARNYWPRQMRRLVTSAGFTPLEVGFVWPVLEFYPWLPDRLAQAYRQRIDRLDDVPGLRRLGVSNLIIATR